MPPERSPGGPTPPTGAPWGGPDRLRTSHTVLRLLGHRELNDHQRRMLAALLFVAGEDHGSLTPAVATAFEIAVQSLSE